MAGKEKIPDDRGEKSVNLDVRKFLKNQALVGSFRILLLHFIAIKQFGGRINKKINWYFQKFHFWDINVNKLRLKLCQAQV